MSTTSKIQSNFLMAQLCPRFFRNVEVEVPTGERDPTAIQAAFEAKFGRRWFGMRYPYVDPDFLRFWNDPRYFGSCDDTGPGRFGG